MFEAVLLPTHIAGAYCIHKAIQVLEDGLASELLLYNFEPDQLFDSASWLESDPSVGNLLRRILLEGRLPSIKDIYKKWQDQRQSHHQPPSSYLILAWPSQLLRPPELARYIAELRSLCRAKVGLNILILDGHSVEESIHVIYQYYCPSLLAIVGQGRCFAILNGKESAISGRFTLSPTGKLMERQEKETSHQSHG